jgi:uncharacterized membrane protein
MVPIPRRPSARHAQESEANVSGRLERLIFLSDGVFAIAMTLLAVDLAISAIGSGAEPGDIAPRLLALWPKFLSFALSFVVIASYWSAHQHVFSAVVRTDDLLVQLNMPLLFCIAFLPVPTNVLGSYGNEPASVILYAGTLVVTHGLVLALWIYATIGRRLVAADLDSRLIRRSMWRLAVVPLVFLISIAIAPFNPSLAEYSWLSIAVILFVARRVERRTP